MKTYSDPSRENDKYSLPDVEIFQLTAREVAERDEEAIYEFSKRHEFRLASMNGTVRDSMFDAMIEENGITGGWFWWTCLPGCMPDSDAFGPFASADEARKDAQSQNE